MFATIDFETEAITGDPLDYPPEPVGVAIKFEDGASVYHRGTPSELRDLLLPLWDEDLLFHNASFDVLVAMMHCELPMPRVIHDTLPLLFLQNPYARTLSLKPSAEALLDLPPDEQADLKAWIVANVPGATARNFGAHIARAPYELVKPYAEGDTDRTKALWNALQDWRGEAYDREMALLPTLLENELRGIPVAVERLAADAALYQRKLARVDELLHAELGGSFDIDSNEELADRIERSTGMALPLTEKGQRRTDKDTLFAAPLGAKAKALLLYRSALAQNLRTFLLPWHHMAEASGSIFTHWNSIRGASERKQGGGARTGRLSSEPNFQNIPSVEKVGLLYARLAGLLNWTEAAVRQKLSLPSMRSYIVPAGEDWVIFGRDFSQQELRLLAYFEADVLHSMYASYPTLDVHEFVGGLIQEVTGKALPRKTVKVLNFCNVYGGGAAAIARQGDMSEATAREVQALYFNSLPSVKALMREVSSQQSVRTLGQRTYHAEPKFEYRLLNYLIQGSAADQTKEALVRWSRSGSQAQFYLTVHDELVFSCPAKDVDDEMQLLKEAMDGAFADRLDVPFHSDGYISKTWALDD
jgi:DNA polymerase I-like protein with 3'-5' exonuclease and polymerase domains